ncbi:MAG: hypothetical protein COC19_03015 [SAR86 cluster bacterium]|uniref:Uncharacterized protein n=1 Tax=SAR86 cluster bacterium TaxID=2030880 RepID=A0A2A4MR53_9GAMM|nr:MAG: hypothetical protein COC19_03015 [SAR86 cluster bacterium]
MKTLSLVIFLLLSVNSIAQIHDPIALDADPFSATSAIAPRLDGLGDFHFEVTTDNAQSQYFFDQGMRLNAGFNHSEALRAFKEAIRLDPNNAMAFWGWALVLGPNLNLPMQDSVVDRAYQAMQRGLALKGRLSQREADYIDALALRYSADGSGRAALDKVYAEAMGALSEKYPDDLDAATLYAAALMNTNPWDYWYLDGSPKAHTQIVMEVLASVLERNPNNAAANHYWVHVVEAYRPELGVAAADALLPLMPAAGHLVHMPSHIYMRVGRYKDSWDVNAAASLADENYIEMCNAQGVLPLGYYPHNLHFQVWSAMFLGDSENAMAASRKIIERMPQQLSNNPFGANETFASQAVFTLVRFGLWEELLAEAQPPAEALYMQGIWHYGRGLARVHKGNMSQANSELADLHTAIAAVQAQPGYGIGFAAAEGLLSIAVNVLQGEIAAAQGDYTAALGYLDKAVRVQDTMRYNEPPDWYFPVRHILGAVLLEADLAGEAEVVYWEDLRRNPGNGYALFGLAQSLRVQGKQDILAEIEQRFAVAWQYGDVSLTTSRF